MATRPQQSRQSHHLVTPLALAPEAVNEVTGSSIQVHDSVYITKRGDVLVCAMNVAEHFNRFQEGRGDEDWCSS